MRVTSVLTPNLIRAIEETALVMLVVGPVGTEALKETERIAQEFGASTAHAFEVFVADVNDEKEALLVQGAGLAPGSEKTSVVLYHDKEYAGRLTDDISVEKLQELMEEGHSHHSC
jgi:hypothetical protein